MYPEILLDKGKFDFELSSFTACLVVVCAEHYERPFEPSLKRNGKLVKFPFAQVSDMKRDGNTVTYFILHNLSKGKYTLGVELLRNNPNPDQTHITFDCSPYDFVVTETCNIQLTLNTQFTSAIFFFYKNGDLGLPAFEHRVVKHKGKMVSELYIPALTPGNYSVKVEATDGDFNEIKLPEYNMKKLSNGSYLVRSQAGFDRALKDFDPDGEYIRESNAFTYPKSYPSVVKISSFYRGADYLRTVCTHVNTYKVQLLTVLGELENE